MDHTRAFKLTALLLTVAIDVYHSIPIGYSYTQFIGPVSGPEKKIFINDEGGGRNHVDVDYVAQPDYHFSYGVEDAKSGVLQNRAETRHGDTVKGEYSVVDPDGNLRIVKYSADNVNGFQAEVINKGKSVVHGPPAVAPASIVNHEDGNGQIETADAANSREEDYRDDDDDDGDDGNGDGRDNTIDEYDERENGEHDEKDEDGGASSNESGDDDEYEY